MTFFTPIQLRVLKTSWLPGIVGFILSTAISPFLLDGAENVLTALSWAIGIFFIVAWEAIIKRDLKQLVIIGGVIALTLLVKLYYSAFMEVKDPLLLYINEFAILLIIMITRFYLNEMGDKLNAALLATLVYFIMPRGGNPFGAVTIGSLGLSAQWGIVTQIVLSQLVFFNTLVAYYVIVFLSENSYRRPLFFIKLQSRIETVGKGEYFFIFISLWFIYMGGIGDLTMLVANFFNGTTPPMMETAVVIFRLLLLVLMMYSIAGLMRNIITGRMLTTGRYNPWLFVLHYIPVINIAAVIKTCITADKPATQEEHGLQYLEAGRHRAQWAMIIAGIAVTVYNIYVLLTAPTGLRLPMISVIALLYMAKIFAYLKLRSSKTYLYLVLALNVATTLFALNEYLLLSLSFLFLYYYMMQELFYPALQPEDTMKIQEPEAGDIFTHTA
jgi:hypothetical protein